MTVAANARTTPERQSEAQEAETLQNLPFEQLKRAAEAGEPAAQFWIAMRFATGQGVSKAPKKAVDWCRKAAEQGYAPAQCGLGAAYLKGEGVKQDYTEAFKWFQRSAEQGLPRAAYFLAVMYGKGLGVPSSRIEANKWGNRALAQGDCLAQFDAGLAYAKGTGVPQNFVEAYAWLSLAASQGLKQAAEQRDEVARKMTPEQISQGQRMVKVIIAEYRKAARGGSKVQTEGQVTDELRGSGTGFFITEDGYLVTNFHVVEDASHVVVKIGGETLQARVVKTDPVNDLALLKVSASSRALPVTSTRSVRPGDGVLTVGFPNIVVQGEAPKLTRGEISSLSGVQDDPRCFQTSVPIQPGNSGGPLVDRSGNVVGVVSARLNDEVMLTASGHVPQNVNYAVKSSFLLAFLETVPEVADKLRQPATANARGAEEIVNDVLKATVIVLVY